jgi:AGCS family alanine or glycine:cation symporter
MQVFLLVDAAQGRDRILGEIVGTEGYAEAIRWGEVPAGARWVEDGDGRPITGVFRNFAGATLTGHAFDRAFPGLGKWMVTLAAWLFAVSTMISWSYYGEQAVVYMAGKRWVLFYKFGFLALAIVGAVLVKNNKELGDLADFGTGWMLWANMLIVLSLGFLAVRTIGDYFRRLDAGAFHPHAKPTITDVVDGKDVEE